MQSLLAKYPRNSAPYSPDLVPCNFWLYPKLKSPLKGKRSNHQWEIQENTIGQLMAIGRTVWGSKVSNLKGTKALLPCVQCSLYVVSSSINAFIFRTTWLDTFWIDLGYLVSAKAVTIGVVFLHIDFCGVLRKIKDLRGQMYSKITNWNNKLVYIHHLYSLSTFLRNIFRNKLSALSTSLTYYFRWNWSNRLDNSLGVLAPISFQILWGMKWVDRAHRKMILSMTIIENFKS